MLTFSLCRAARRRPRGPRRPQGEIDPILADKLLHKGSVGVEIIRLGEKPAEDETVYERNAV